MKLLIASLTLAAMAAPALASGNGNEQYTSAQAPVAQQIFAAHHHPRREVDPYPQDPTCAPHEIRVFGNCVGNRGIFNN